MKIISLNVGRPKVVVWEGNNVRTSIFKSSVLDARQIRNNNIDGDEQSDLRYHGGENKAVYAYDVSHYTYWKSVLDQKLTPGMFGENLTTDGLLDHKVNVGDVFQIGTVKLKAVQPRFPCYKLNLRFGRKGMLEQFKKAKRLGIYFKVEEEGELKAGDEIILINKDPEQLKIQDLSNSLITKGADQAILRKILVHQAVPNSLKEAFETYIK